MATAQQISLDAQLILNTVTSILPLLSAIPQVGQNQQLINYPEARPKVCFR